MYGSAICAYSESKIQNRQKEVAKLCTNLAKLEREHEDAGYDGIFYQLWDLVGNLANLFSEREQKPKPIDIIKWMQ